MNIEPIGVIHEDSTMRNAWLKGKPLSGKSAKQETQKITLALDAAETIMGEMEAIPRSVY
jgi:hypothetical protein